MISAETAAARPADVPGDAWWPAEISDIGSQPALRRPVHHSGLVWLAIFGVIALMVTQLPPMIARQDAVTHAYSALVEVDALAKQRYVERIAPDRLVEGAIRGMLRELDPYSGYIAPDELPAFERRQHGEFTGVGLELGMRAGRLAVIAPLEGSPASQAGVRPGDWLVSVNGIDLKERSVFDVEELLAGPSGTHVDVTVQHAGSQDRETIRITRGPVTLTSVRGPSRGPAGGWEFLIDPNWRIGYIRVSMFHDLTVDEFDAALADLHREAARALVLDLRFNPGGKMDKAIEMVDRFVNDGVVLSTVNRHGAVDEYRAKPQTTLWDNAVIVLVNEASASSAEIVAGSLQARGRAKVVGERSFGKGSVQHLIQLIGQKAAVKLTVAYYRLPDGRIIHRTEANSHTSLWGVLPDVEIALSDEEYAQIQASRRDLDRSSHLPRTRPSPETDSPNETVLLIDRQLRAAIDLAKDMLSDTN